MKVTTRLLLVAALGLSFVCVSQQSLHSAQAEKQPAWSLAPGIATDFINSVAICADGTKLVAGTYYNTYLKDQDPKPKWGDSGTFCYDAKGNLLWKDVFTGYIGVYWVDLSADGNWAVSGGTFSNKPYAGFVRIYDAKAGVMLKHFPTSERVNLVAISADGGVAISACNTLRLYTRSGTEYSITDEFALTDKDDSVYTADLSADGSRIVCGTVKSGMIYLFQNKDGKLTKLAEWKLPSLDKANTMAPYSHCIRMTPSGKSFATGGDAGHLYIFDEETFVKTGNPSVDFDTKNTGPIYSVALSDDAQAMVGLANASGGTGIATFVVRNGSVGKKLWDRALTRNPNRVQLDLPHGMVAIADGHPLYTPGNFYLLDAVSGNIRWQYQTPNMSWPICISKNGTAIVGGSDDSKVYFFTP